MYYIYVLRNILSYLSACSPALRNTVDYRPSQFRLSCVAINSLCVKCHLHLIRHAEVTLYRRHMTV